MDNLQIGIDRAMPQAGTPGVLGHSVPPPDVPLRRIARRESAATGRSRRCALVARSVATLLALLSTGCASEATARVPRRLATGSPTIGVGSADAALGRNDARLGARRPPFVREAIDGVATVDDRQWIVNGRPYVDFESRTRSATRLSR